MTPLVGETLYEIFPELATETTPLDWADRLVGPHRDSRERRESIALHKALRLAPDLVTFEALLGGEAVPLSRLDPRWRRAYGL